MARCRPVLDWIEGAEMGARFANALNVFEADVPLLPQLASEASTLRHVVQRIAATPSAAAAGALLQRLYQRSCRIFSVRNSIAEAVAYAYADPRMLALGRMTTRQAMHAFADVEGMMDENECMIAAMRKLCE